MLVLTPSTLDRKRGRMLITISLEMSMKKLVRLTAQTLRGRERSPPFCKVSGFSVIESFLMDVGFGKSAHIIEH